MTKPPRYESLSDWLFPPIAESQAAAIGRVTAHWSMVEGDLGKIIQYLLHLPDVAGGALVAEVSTLSRLETVGTLLNLTADKNIIAKWTIIRKEIDRLRPMRNDIVHGEWMFHAGEHAVARKKARGSYVYEFYIAPSEDIDLILDDIKRIFDKISSFISDIHANKL